MSFVLEANLDNLRRCARNTERAKHFDLSICRSDCGTYGCLLGNDAAACGLSRLEVWDRYGGHFAFGSREYNIPSAIDGSSHIGSFLFGFKKRHGKYSKEACLSRLYKFIAYCERKRAMLYEADGRVKESARRNEGDYMFCKQVLQSLATAV